MTYHDNTSWITYSYQYHLHIGSAANEMVLWKSTGTGIFVSDDCSANENYRGGSLYHWTVIDHIIDEDYIHVFVGGNVYIGGLSGTYYKSVGGGSFVSETFYSTNHRSNCSPKLS